MGQTETKLTKKDITHLRQVSHFNEDELRALHARFLEISSAVEADGVIDQEELRQALRISNRVLCNRIFRLFDANNDGQINFVEFVQVLSVLAKGTTEEKLKFSFRLYDVDGDGHIDKEELYQMLSASLVDSTLTLSEKEMRDLIDRTFAEVDNNNDGHISFEEYFKMASKTSTIADSLTIHLGRDEISGLLPAKLSASDLDQIVV